MPETPDLAVIGAGPAGLGAALTARAAGLDVLLIDEAPLPGGQGSLRAPPDRSPGAGPEGARGDALRRALAGSGIAVLTEHKVWTLSTAPIRLSLAGPGPLKTVRPRALLVAAGATERVMPFPGWTLPGVVGLAAATVLMNSLGAMPPGPVVVAGRGPLLAAAAAGLLDRGMNVACVVDEASRADWIRAMPDLLRRPGQVWRGLSWLRRIRAAGVPILHGHRVAQALGSDWLRGVLIEPCRRSSRPSWVVPARLLAVGQGLVPSTEILRLLGVPLCHRAAEGAWLPMMGLDGRTAVLGLYAAGDGTGIRGAEAAELGGRLAALSVMEDFGVWYGSGAERRWLRRRHRRAERAGAAMARLMTPGADQLAAIPPETVVCRCEDVTRAEIDDAFADGAADLNQLKSRTRCGMGPCQGRICAPAVAGLAALHECVAEPIRPWTVRPPLRPVPIGELVGEFDYGEIPSVTPAI